jgi:hypothetical protein
MVSVFVQGEYEQMALIIFQQQQAGHFNLFRPRDVRPSFSSRCMIQKFMPSTKTSPAGE